MSTYLDNGMIDIYDPESRESLLAGVFQNAFLQLKLETVNNRNEPIEKQRTYNTRSSPLSVKENTQVQVGDKNGE